MATVKHLEGKSAIVTGSGRGIGREIALLLAQQGARVLVNDPGVGRGGEQTDERPADEVVAAIRNAGGIAVANYDSVADYKKSGAMVEQCVAEFGSIDLVMSVHVKGHWNMSHHAIRHMRRNGYGRIVNFSSDAFKGAVGQCNYAAAKGAIISLSRSIAKEAARYGITCNAICPTADTRMTMTEEVMANRRRRLASGLITQAEFDRAMIPRGPEYVAPMVGYLCTEQAYWLNGNVFHVERGRIHNFYFGEIMSKLYKEEDEGMFTVNELLQKVPEMMKDIPPVVPPVKASDAQKYTGA